MINKPIRRIEILLRVAAGLVPALLVPVAIAQQTSVPGVVPQETEATEEVREYRVELIVFEHMDSATAGTEVFMPDAAPETYLEDQFSTDVDRTPSFGDARTIDAGSLSDATSEEIEPSLTGPQILDSADTVGEIEVAAEEINYDDIELVEIPTYEQSGLRVLAADEFELSDVYARMQRLDAYRPILHTAWTQPTLEKDATLPIDLRRLGDPPLRLDGTISLYLGRFLHLVVDLALEDRAAGFAADTQSRQRRYGDSRWDFRQNSRFDTPPVFYRIQEDRILRNGEMRYYDHPRFGIVAKVSRVEPTGEDSGTNAPSSR